jgi:hypothetical protein
MSDHIESFINEAIEGQSDLLLENTPKSHIWVISQLECDCDINGIDAFIARYGKAGLILARDAHAAIRSESISRTLDLLINDTDNEEFLVLCNDQITDRTGYSYESIYKYVDECT